MSAALVTCPRCDAAGGWCDFCGRALCDEDEIEQHPADADWTLCPLCEGTGEVSASAAALHTRRTQRPAAVPQRLRVELGPEADVPF